MGLFDKIRRHAAVARGDFNAMFGDVEIPPLPAEINQLILEINKAEPDIDRLAKLISSSPSITAKILHTVNSSLYSLRIPVADVKRAVTLLGLENLRSITLGIATMEALPEPRGRIFDHGAFWVDSLLQAIVARSLARKSFFNQLEEVFTASLLADLAIPVLLSVWQDYYEPIIDEWKQSSKTLSEIERESFGWDHGQAGAWIMQTWEFPEEMICYLGLHNMPMEKIEESGLEDTIAVPMAIAAMVPSVLKPDPAASLLVYRSATCRLSLEPQEFVDDMNTVKAALEEILELFGLVNHNTARIIDDLVSAADMETGTETS